APCPPADELPPDDATPRGPEPPPRRTELQSQLVHSRIATTTTSSRAGPASPSVKLRNSSVVLSASAVNSHLLLTQPMSLYVLPAVSKVNSFVLPAALTWSFFTVGSWPGLPASANVTRYFCPFLVLKVWRMAPGLRPLRSRLRLPSAAM